MIEMPGIAAFAVLTVCMLIKFAVFVILAFLRGTATSSRFGPDTLLQTEAAA